MQQIIHGYGRYHAVLAVVGGLFLSVLLWLTLKFWLKFKHIPKISRFKWSFERKVYFGFGIVFATVALFLALIVVANVSTAAKPLPGFSGGISSMATSSYNARLHDALTTG